MGDLNPETVEEIAVELSENMKKQSEKPWPDCFKFAHQLRVKLEEDYNIDSDYLQVVGLTLENEYTHYVLVVSGIVFENNTSAVIDGSFRQFGDDVESSPTVGPGSEIDPVVFAQPKGQYTFIQ